MSGRAGRGRIRIRWAAHRSSAARGGLGVNIPTIIGAIAVILVVLKVLGVY
jgi:hypothetical protein